MTSLTIEAFAPPSGARGARALDHAGRRAGDELAGRTVWCVAALPAGVAEADEARRRLSGPARVARSVRWLEQEDDDPRMQLGRRLDGGGFDPADAELCADCAALGDAWWGAAIARDDVALLHDALTVTLAPALRERGAHVILCAHGDAAARAAWRSLERYLASVDAYVTHGPHGVTALMPWAGMIAAKDLEAPAWSDSERLAWACAVADVVHDDRHEHVGGTLRPRPAVAAR